METKDWKALLTGSHALFCIAVAGGVLLQALEILITATIMPSVVREIGGLRYYAWSTTFYILGSIIGSVAAPRCLAKFGPRNSYKFAACVFCTGSLLCAAAPTMPFFIMGRSVQGLGAGLFSIAYPLIRRVLPQQLWDRAVSLLSGIWSIATLIGPFIGGFFAQYSSWRAAFVVLVPTAILYVLALTDRAFAAAGTQIQPEPHQQLPLKQPVSQLQSKVQHNVQLQPQQTTSPIMPSRLLIVIAAVLIVSASGLVDDLHIGIPGLLIALGLIAALAQIENRSTKHLFAAGTFSLKTAHGVTFAVVALMCLVISPISMFLPYVLQVLYGYPAIVAGYITTIPAAAWALGSLLVAGAKKRVVQMLLYVGLLLTFIGFTSLAILLAVTSISHTGTALLPISLAIAGYGFGMGICWPYLITHVMYVAPPGEQDLASASITTIELTADAFGTALAGVVANLAGFCSPDQVSGTAHAVSWVFGLASLAPLCAMFLLPRVVSSLQVGKSE